MEPGQVLALLIVVAFPTLLLVYMARRFFAYRERQLDVETSLAAEKTAQYANANAELEQRLRVLEQIVTDRGIDTATQIEALRPPRLTGKQVR